LNDRKPSAVIEIGDGDAHRRAIDAVVGNDRAFEAEFGIERHFTRIADGIAFDVDVGGGVASHRGERAIADPVVFDDHVARAKHIDGVPYWPEPPARLRLSRCGCR